MQKIFLLTLFFVSAVRGESDFLTKWSPLLLPIHATDRLVAKNWARRRPTYFYRIFFLDEYNLLQLVLI